MKCRDIEKDTTLNTIPSFSLYGNLWCTNLIQRVLKIFLWCNRP